ncbi:hypothetical protein AB0I28_32420 [Phytomonospora sp. NPDC050363]|uniref:hypothetical protein n=1 Tax=Phytomonospora sp. NPDC050363 TaxID=3155642 RepID=UPI0033F0C302
MTILQASADQGAAQLLDALRGALLAQLRAGQSLTDLADAMPGDTVTFIRMAWRIAEDMTDADDPTGRDRTLLNRQLRCEHGNHLTGDCLNCHPDSESYTPLNRPRPPAPAPPIPPGTTAAVADLWPGRTATCYTTPARRCQLRVEMPCCDKRASIPFNLERDPVAVITCAHTGHDITYTVDDLTEDIDGGHYAHLTVTDVPHTRTRRAPTRRTA